MSDKVSQVALEFVDALIHGEDFLSNDPVQGVALLFDKHVVDLIKNYDLLISRMNFLINNVNNCRMVTNMHGGIVTEAEEFIDEAIQALKPFKPEY